MTTEPDPYNGIFFHLTFFAKGSYKCMGTKFLITQSHIQSEHRLHMNGHVHFHYHHVYWNQSLFQGIFLPFMLVL